MEKEHISDFADRIAGPALIQLISGTPWREIVRAIIRETVEWTKKNL